jgi:hypothetical protein
MPTPWSPTNPTLWTFSGSCPENVHKVGGRSPERELTERSVFERRAAVAPDAARKVLARGSAALAAALVAKR